MRYYIISGEASGDLHSANLIKALKSNDEDADFRAWGGDLMQKEGATLVKHYTDLAFMGFVEVLFNIHTILKNIKFCKSDIIKYKPDVLILVDYPGFNLRIAEFAHKAGIKVFYYISPQLWAWKKSRVKKIKKYVDRMFVILPFEQEFYNNFDYKVDFVGHPLLDVLHPSMVKNDERGIFIENNSLHYKPIVALLPGSRRQEISTMLPVMLMLVPLFKDHQFVIAGSPSVPKAFYEQFLKYKDVGIVFNQTYKLLSCSEAAIVTSGTASLETALLEVPEIVCYKGNYFSYLIARALISVEYIALPNLILNKGIVKELIQDDFNVNNLKKELAGLLFNEEKRAEIISGYKELKEILGGQGASQKTADLMIKYLTNK